MGGRVSKHSCDEGSKPFEWDACDGTSYYTVNEVVVVPSTLRAFSTVTFDKLSERIDEVTLIGQETTLIGHFVKYEDAKEEDKYQGLFYIREEEPDPAAVEPEEPPEPCEEEPCEAPEPVPAPAPISIFEGPITRLSSAQTAPLTLESPETWNVMWIMGCPVHIHPDMILEGPTIQGRPIRGKNIFDLLDDKGERGHALSIIGATGKGFAERQFVPDGLDGEREIYVMQGVVVELAENVIIYPDASDASFDAETDTLWLFPNGAEGYQLKVKISTDRNFPGHWLDAGGETLGGNTIADVVDALMNAPDWSLGLGGYFSIAADDDDGKGYDTGTFFVVEGETTAPPAELPAVLINRYNLRYDSNAFDVRMEIRGQYVSNSPIVDGMEVSVVMKHIEGDGAFPCTEDEFFDDCLVASARGIDQTGRPGMIVETDESIEETEACEVDPEFPNVCNFRIRVRAEGIEVMGLGVSDAPIPSWPDYHSSLKLQYLTEVFTIIVTAEDGAKTKAEATPGRIRVD